MWIKEENTITYGDKWGKLSTNNPQQLQAYQQNKTQNQHNKTNTKTDLHKIHIEAIRYNHL